ncbi:MAG: caspase domain-containing protein [Elusimicrobiota bacterium]
MTFRTALLLLALTAASGCGTVIARHPVGPDVPEMSFVDAKRDLIGQLKSAQLETAGFKYATMKSGFKFKVREEGVDFDYTKYAGIMDSEGHPVSTSCDFAYLDDLSVGEYSDSQNPVFKYEIALGPSCDNLGVFFSSPITATAFARTLTALKKRVMEGKTGSAGTLSKEDLSSIVQAAVSGAAQAPKPAAASLVSDVDAPSGRMPERPSDYAVVVGIEKYSDLPDARFAERDADAVKNNLIALGFPSRNVVLLGGEKAGYKSIEKFVETWLPRNVDETSRVFFYFSGHGAPDVKTGQAYLVPWDGDAGFLENTGYPLKRLYEKLGALKSRQVLVALDACFSGAGGRSVLAKGARPLMTKTDSGSAPPANVAVFAAASGEQITSTLDEKGHGTFTYYFLKGLGGDAKDASGAVTLGGLQDYVKPRVADAARRQNREQVPVLLGSRDGDPLARY